MKKGNDKHSSTGTSKHSERASKKRSTVTLNHQQIQLLQAVYMPFAKARTTYKTGEAWSFDVSIPYEAIKADRQKMLAVWIPLSQVLKDLQIHDLSSANIQLPKRFIGGRKQFTSLLKWLADDEHLTVPV